MKEQDIKNLMVTFHLEKDEQFIRQQLKSYAAGTILFEELARAILDRKQLPMHRVADFLVMLVRLVGEPRVTPEDDVTSDTNQEQSPRALIEQLVAEAPVSEDVRSRVHRALVSFAKGVRNELQVFEQLTKQTQQGGAGMSSSDANHIIQELDEYIRRVGEEQVHRALEEGALIDARVADVAIDNDATIPTGQPHRLFDHAPITQIEEFAPHVKQHEELLTAHKELAPPPPATQRREEPKKNASSEVSAVIKDTVHELFETSSGIHARQHAPSAPVSDDIARVVKKPQRTRTAQQSVPKAIKQLVEQEVAQEAVLPRRTTPTPSVPTTQPQPKRRGFFSRLFARSGNRVPQTYAPKQPSQPSAQSSAQVRPTLDDVTYTPKLFSATDELASLTVQDFRRLSANPQTAADKLRMKLEVLAQDSLIKRKEGVVALQQSPLYKAYADILNTSLLQGVSFEQAVAAQQALTREEFEAIMAFNKTLQA